MPRLIGQAALIEVARRILNHEAGIAHRVHRLLRTTSCQKVHAGKIALAAVFMGRDEAARGDNQGAVFAVVRV